MTKVSSKIEINRPLSIELTLSVTMSFEHWHRLQDQLDAASTKGTFPLWYLRQQIDALLAKARQGFVEVTEHEH